MGERGGKEVGMLETVERDQKAAREAKATTKAADTKAWAKAWAKAKEMVAKALEACLR